MSNITLHIKPNTKMKSETNKKVLQIKHYLEYVYVDNTHIFRTLHR